MGTRIEGLAAKAARLVKRDKLGGVVGHVLEVRRRVQQCDDAAGDVHGVGASTVQLPPCPLPEELLYKVRFSHDK